jgi:hypothetical protein
LLNFAIPIAMTTVQSWLFHEVSPD